MNEPNDWLLPDEVNYSYARDWCIYSSHKTTAPLGNFRFTQSSVANIDFYDLRRTLNGRHYYLNVNKHPTGQVDLTVYAEEEETQWKLSIDRTVMFKPSTEDILDWADSVLFSPMDLLAAKLG